MKARNHVIYNTSRDELKRLADEYRMIGRDVKLEEDKLIVFALPRKKQQAKRSRR